MKLFFLIIRFLVCCPAYSQTKRLPYQQKFYKLKQEVYGIRYIKKEPTPYVLFTDKKGKDQVDYVFPYKKDKFGILTGSYPGLLWDINKESFFVLEVAIMGPEIGRELRDLCFYPKKESEYRGNFNAHLISSGMGLSDFLDRRIMNRSRKAYWHYDFVLRPDDTFIVPVAWKDTLYLYTYPYKHWTKPEYEWQDNDSQKYPWTITAQTIHSFKTSFRAFELDKQLYFLTNADSSLYKYQDNTLKEIGRLRLNKKEDMLFLIDKDDNKVYFLRAAGLEIFVEEERKRFQLLTKEDPLFKAVQKIIDTSDVREKAGKK